MYFNTHLYFVKKNISNPNPIIIIGVCLPDSALYKIISWTDLHEQEKINQFENFIQKNRPDWADLVTGLNYHLSVDNMSHHKFQNKGGYAYTHQTPKLRKLVKEAIGIKDPQAVKTTAHNYIEFAVDSWLMEKNPELQQNLKAAALQIDRAKLREILRDFFKKEVPIEALDRFCNSIYDYNTANIEECVLLCDEVNKQLFNKPVQAAKAREAIELARELVKDSYPGFLSTSITV